MMRSGNPSSGGRTLASCSEIGPKFSESFEFVEEALFVMGFSGGDAEELVIEILAGELVVLLAVVGDFRWSFGDSPEWYWSGSVHESESPRSSDVIIFFSGIGSTGNRN